MKARYIVGIDLGTTNSAVGYVDLHDASPGSINILTFDVPQIVGQDRVAERPTLPSSLYLSGEYDLQAGAMSLPWDPDRTYAVGTFARDQGGLVWKMGDLLFHVSYLGLMPASLAALGDG
ncbi:MAG: hypothetical protein JRJ14_04120 [Deltaproteobacteria bacterium]|nr:hypothetical protein [Deltaproteobacteria bacterium]